MDDFAAWEYADIDWTDTPEARAEALEHRIEVLPQSRRLRRDPAYARALADVDDATRGLRKMVWYAGDIPLSDGVEVDEEVLEQAQAALDAIELADLIAAVAAAEASLAGILTAQPAPFRRPVPVNTGQPRIASSPHLTNAPPAQLAAPLSAGELVAA